MASLHPPDEADDIMQEAQNNDLGVSHVVIQETLEGKQGKKVTLIPNCTAPIRQTPPATLLGCGKGGGRHGTFLASLLPTVLLQLQEVCIYQLSLFQEI